MGDCWLLLRVPRSPVRGEISTVLGTGDRVIVERQLADVPTAIARGLAAAAGEKPTVIDPLDGRHGLAGAILEEAQRRGLDFARHPPAGAARHLIDLDGPDAEPQLAGDALMARVDALGEEAGAALRASELAESMAILRQIITVGARHLGWWDANTLWALANLVRVAAATGAAENVREGAELARHAVAQPLTPPPPNPVRSLARLQELAQNCQAAGEPASAATVMHAAVELARVTQGDGHPNHLGMLNGYAVLLTAQRDPRAETILREVLERARRTLGERHANIAIILSNLADVVDQAGRADEARALREEAARIRGG